jgi:beta-galactosidase
MNSILKCFILLLISLSSVLTDMFSQNKYFSPGKIWKDIDGNAINAHGGGILFHNNKYYWYGEMKTGETRLVPDQNWECYRVDVTGISCYSSTDLYNWEFENIVLKPNFDNPQHDLHTSKVLERPKVIYNVATKKFVMWMHIDSEDYAFSRAGVAVSDSPTGPFQYIESVRPNGQMSRDMTIFKDTDGKAYHIFSSETNATMRIVQLTDDYLRHTNNEKRILINQHREAPAMFKRGNKYYLITSACSGWAPNAASIICSDSIWGEWTVPYNPCVGKNSSITFNSQSTYVIPVQDKPDTYIFMADRWNKTDLEKSLYVWLPITFEGNKVSISWKNKWR